MPVNTDNCLIIVIYTKLLGVISRKKFGLLKDITEFLGGNELQYITKYY